MYLLGMSKGVTGTLRTLLEFGLKFRGVVLISPCVDPQLGLRLCPSKPVWRGLRVLAILGGADNRIPYESARHRLFSFKSAGAVVSQLMYPAADHFLFFSHQDRMFTDIWTWMQAGGDGDEKSDG